MINSIIRTCFGLQFLEKSQKKEIVSSFRSIGYQSRLHFWLYCLLNIKLFNLIIDLFQAKPFR